MVLITARQDRGGETNIHPGTWTMIGGTEAEAVESAMRGAAERHPGYTFTAPVVTDLSDAARSFVKQYGP